jgi:hypothetical protein
MHCGVMVMKAKCIALGPVEDWIREERKEYIGASMVWKELVKVFPFVAKSLAWKIGRGSKTN